MDERLKKVRIRLYDKAGTPTSDRLVTQSTEFAAGPKDVIEEGGSVSIEAFLSNKDDVQAFVSYLEKLNGKVPHKELGSKGRPKNGTKKELTVAERKDFVDEILLEVDKKGWNQDKLIETLRDKHQFRFISEDFAMALHHRYGDDKSNPLGVKSVHFNKFVWMVRLVRLAADPKNDKYDPLISFGFRFDGGRSDRVVVYLEGQFYKRFKTKVPLKPKVTEKNISAIRYPAFMTYDERAKFRNELRKAKRGKEPSKFLLKWMPHMEEVNEGHDELRY